MILSETDVNRFRSGVNHLGPDECWLWERSCLKAGYGCFRLNGKTELSHRVSWFLANGPIPNLFEGRPTQICHTCDNPPCCNPTHLYLGNNLINQKDSANKGRPFKPVGVANPKARITELQAKKIKVHCLEGELTHKEIAKIYRVTLVTVRNICSGKTWSHLN